MPSLDLPRTERLELKARAHHLNPVVLLGAQGLTPAALKEIDRALTAHGLIKVRAPGEDRDERERLFAAMSEQLSAAPVGNIGKVLILYRPQPEEAAAPPAPAARKRKARPLTKKAAAARSR